jgi:DNA-directed RNA polymerase specialized sigma24 family protein
MEADAEERLAAMFGGTWRCWSRDVQMPGLEVGARYARSDSGRWVLTGVVLMGDALTADQLRAVPVAALENSMNLSDEGAEAARVEIEKLPPLARQAGMSPEEFSDLVAQHYRAWAALVPHPAAAIASAQGVKVPTVHTWIREARLRGLLPPARRGKRPAEGGGVNDG